MTWRPNLLLDRPEPMDAQTAFWYILSVDNLAKQDPLGEALHFLRMSGVSYCRSDLTAPWGLFLPLAEGCGRFHLVMSGTAVLRVGKETLKLEAGDLILLPRGDGHHLLDDPTSPITQLQDLPCEHENE